MLALQAESLEFYSEDFLVRSLLLRTQPPESLREVKTTHCNHNIVQADFVYGLRVGLVKCQLSVSELHSLYKLPFFTYLDPLLVLVSFIAYKPG